MRKGRKAITLPAGILILLFTLMPLGGCQQENEGFQSQLSAADSLMQTDADSAFRMAFLHSGVLCLPVSDGAALGVEIDAHLHYGQS